MTSEQSFFLRVLRDYLHGTATEVPAGLDWEAICSAAELHQLEGIVYAQCRARLEQEPDLNAAREQLSAAFARTVCHNANLEADDQRVRAGLRAAGIPFLPVKGPEAAAFYPDPALRTMGDIDLLVRAADRDAVLAVLQEAGFYRREASEDEWIFVRGPSCFECHTLLFRSDEDDNPDRIAWFNNFWAHTGPGGSGSEGRLDPDFHFLYLVAHIAKHIRGRGIGFRQFYDLAMLIRNGGGIFSWETVRADAEKLGLLPFLRTCMTLCVRWFGIEAPIAPAELSEEAAERITERTFRDGVFGFGSRENNIGLLERSRQKSRLPLPLLKLKTSARLLFPPYRQLIAAEKYRSLRNRPWLLPWVWVRRMWAAAGNPKKTSLVTVVLSASGEEVEARNRQLRELGL